MIKRRYTIEATVRTLGRFCTVASIGVGVADVFIHRVTTDSTDTYYYVVLEAPQKVHERLRSERFAESRLVK